MKEKKREISMLSEENSALKSVMKGQEGEMQREINNLLVKMKGLSAIKTELILLCSIQSRLFGTEQDKRVG